MARVYRSRVSIAFATQGPPLSIGRRSIDNRRLRLVSVRVHDVNFGFAVVLVVALNNGHRHGILIALGP
jgi:hypothetical protein